MILVSFPRNLGQFYVLGMLMRNLSPTQIQEVSSQLGLTHLAVQMSGPA